jgi:CBS domain-containing protein
MPVGKSDIGKSLDRGPRDFKTHRADKEGKVMLVAEKRVVTTHPMNSIKNVAGLMEKHDFRRIPVTDAGTNRLEGMAVAIDILDFLGGGEKYNIILKDYKGNFLSAINCPINKIMNPDHPFVDKRGSIDDVIEIMMEKRTSAIPIVEDFETKELIAIVTERDVLPIADGFGFTIGESMRKGCITSSLGMMISDVSKIMVRNRLRRLPVILEGELKGIVTVFDVLKFLGYGEFRGINADDVLANTRVEDIMERKVITVTPDQDLALVPKLIKETGIGGFPVVDDGRILGIITTSDVIREVYKG